MIAANIPLFGPISQFSNPLMRNRDAIYPMESSNIPFIPFIPKRNRYSPIGVLNMTKATVQNDLYLHPILHSILQLTRMGGYGHYRNPPKYRAVTGFFLSDPPGTRTRNQWIKSPLLCH